MAHCTGHPRALVIHNGPLARPNGVLEGTPIRLTAGSAQTPYPLGATVLAMHDAKRRPLVTGLPGYRQQVVRLDWPDMSVPDLTPDDWRWLAARLAALKSRALHVHCMAGHGRTGTTLAILAGLWNLVPDDECPITWVRDRYCDSAVETAAQVTYVTDMTGRTVTARPSLGPPPLPPKGGMGWGDDDLPLAGGDARPLGGWRR